MLAELRAGRLPGHVRAGKGYVHAWKLLSAYPTTIYSRDPTPTIRRVWWIIGSLVLGGVVEGGLGWMLGKPWMMVVGLLAMLAAGVLLGLFTPQDRLYASAGMLRRQREAWEAERQAAALLATKRWGEVYLAASSSAHDDPPAQSSGA